MDDYSRSRYPRYPYPLLGAMPLLLGLLFGPWGLGPATAGVQRFEPGSLKAIQAVRQGRPFLLHLWSLDCRPCLEELATLSRLRRQHPELDLVLISTDAAARAPEVEAMLEAHGLQGVESWIFAQSNSERLRYEIDPQWFGELPRNYFYDRAQGRCAVSGKLRPADLEVWIGRRP